MVVRETEGMDTAAMKSGMRAVVDELPEGAFLGPVSHGHYFIVREDGSLLRTPTGLPIKICSSPSDRRTRKNEMARIRRALRD